MRLPFLDRTEELTRLRSFLRQRESSLAVLYGRRRLGKSRLITEALSAGRFASYVGDNRLGALQLAGLATEISTLVPGFNEVAYPDWDSLLTRWWREAPPGSTLVLDEFPYLVSAVPELPGLLQKRIDRAEVKRPHLLLAGSSQRMMQGLVLDRSAPLYGRAREIMKITPLEAGWIRKAIKSNTAKEAVEHYAVWGGVPRYWELAADHEDLLHALRELVLSPLGVLHEEPAGLLLDDMRDTAQAASILALIGQGCHRLFEIGGRLGRPVTSLSRPIQRLIDLGLVRRETPFGGDPGNSKRSLYRVSDPFLRFWFRFVDPHRSRLEAQFVRQVQLEIAGALPLHIAEAWEDLARKSVPRLGCFDRAWRPAGRWWGAGRDRKPLEIDIVAESEDRTTLLLGEAKWGDRRSPRAVLSELQRKAANFPLTRDREVLLAVWHAGRRTGLAGAQEFTPDQVLRVLR